MSLESSRDELPTSSYLMTDYLEIFQSGLFEHYFNSSLMFSGISSFKYSANPSNVSRLTDYLHLPSFFAFLPFLHFFGLIVYVLSKSFSAIQFKWTSGESFSALTGEIDSYFEDSDPNDSSRIIGLTILDPLQSQNLGLSLLFHLNS